MQRLCISLLVALACLLALANAQADAFVRDQLIVYRIGDADYPASPTGTKTVPIYFEYRDLTTGASLSNPIPVRTTDGSANSGNVKCTHSLSAAYTGHLGLSTDKSQIGFGCFRADVGTTSPENSDSKVVNRVVAFLGSSGSVDTATVIGSAEGDAGVGKGYVTSVITPLTGEFGPVSCLTAFSGNTLKPFYGVRMIDRFFGQVTWRQQSDYSGDNARALAMTDPDTPGSYVAYSSPGMLWQYIQSNTRFNNPLSTVFAAGEVPNDPNGIAAIYYNSNYYYYMTDAASPQRIYKGYKKNAVGYNSYYFNTAGGEYFGITARLISDTVYIYVTYRPFGAVYSEVWEFTDAAGEGSFASPNSMRKIFRSDDNTLYKGIAFSPVNVKCRDGKQDSQYDAGIDCGGAVCQDKCGGGQSCGVSSDCQSNNCANGFCAAASCSDGVLNQGEVDVDCAGPKCAKCAGGKFCYVNTDCNSLFCDSGTCTTANCADGVKNSDEVGVDCGGSQCSNIGKAKCPDGQPCTTSGGCTSGYCDAVTNTCQKATCFDNVKNGLESDVDCGPYDSGCPRCDTNQNCDSFDDCDSWTCSGGKCQAPTCTDGQDNGFEPPSGDCGEWCYANEPGGKLCPVNSRCFTTYDCDNVLCGDFDYTPGNLYRGKVVGTCLAASCTDGFKNNFETDIDCGGPVCSKKCPLYKSCTQNSDCEDNYCKNNKCETPKCDDGVKNGAETDVDCGGVLCSQTYNITCAIGKSCIVAADCDFANKVYCISNKCNTLPTPQAPVAAPQGSNTPSNSPFALPPLPDVCATCKAPTPGCDPQIPACVGARIIPIIQCVEEIAGKYYAFFSYENTLNTDVTLTSNVNYFNLDIELGDLPSTYKPGRQDIFPLATFVGSSVNPIPAEWYVDGVLLGFQLDMAELQCPSDLVFQLLSSTDPATLNGVLNNIIESLSSLLGISSAQLNVTISALTGTKRAGGSVINVEVSSVSASAVYGFVTQGGIETINTGVPGLGITGVSSKPLSTEIAGISTPQAVTVPQAGPSGSNSPSGNTPTGGNTPITKTVSGAEQLAACGLLSVALLAVFM